MLHCQRTANFALVCNRMSGESSMHYFKGIYFCLTVLFCLLSGKTPKHKICCSFVLWDFKELSTVCVCVCVYVCVRVCLYHMWGERSYKKTPLCGLSTFWVLTTDFCKPQSLSSHMIHYAHSNCQDCTKWTLECIHSLLKNLPVLSYYV